MSPDLNKLAVVDLGTKKAGAIDVFREHHSIYFPSQKIPEAHCLGLDVQDKYRDVVTNKGYKFQASRIEDFDWVKADYYLAFDFLEHLTSIEQSKEVLKQMLRHATKGVWLRLPSFEEDETNMATLRPLGLRFTWTQWTGHTSHFQKRHVTEAINESEFKGLPVKFVGNLKIKNTQHRTIVPEHAPIDAVRYKTVYGNKLNTSFNPPLIGQWEAIITK